MLHSNNKDGQAAVEEEEHHERKSHYRHFLLFHWMLNIHTKFTGEQPIISVDQSYVVICLHSVST